MIRRFLLKKPTIVRGLFRYRVVRLGIYTSLNEFFHMRMTNLLGLAA